MTTGSYDEALFRQLLAKRKDTNGAIGLDDIFDVFRVVAWDVFLAIAQQKPESMSDAYEVCLETIVPDLAATLESEGWKIRENIR